MSGRCCAQFARNGRSSRHPGLQTMTEAAEHKVYRCLICGYEYDEQKGLPEAGISPGTRWDDIPLSWRCPDCGAGREDFERVSD